MVSNVKKITQTFLNMIMYSYNKKSFVYYYKTMIASQNFLKALTRTNHNDKSLTHSVVQLRNPCIWYL